ncbi:UDP-glucose 4-epimerase GalE [Streptomyces sp. NPDC051976]|uniref:UDP-glucose 4-epimerase GalE n=1 Tax=Streptomyces sp. NPDC051976 TaxID=3154947 RepID=UPI00342322E8
MRRTLSTALVTGGAGFIGSHTCVELLEHGFEVIVVDDYSNSSPEVFARTQRVAGRFLGAVYEFDLRDRQALSEVFDRHQIDVVVHFAGKKMIGESVRKPITYYDVNVGGTLSLLSVMQEHDVHRLVFSSSCSIYGEAERIPLTEADPARPTNPYATSKWACEQILDDICRRHDDWTVLSLRYFNPAGAHPSGLLGEVPRGAPGNVMPYMAQVASGRRERLDVYGDDYPTSDGTGIRDYIHVMDVAEAHRLALEHLPDGSGMQVFNLGLGTGTSVLELLAAFSDACGRPIPYKVVDRRPGDVTALVADPSAVARAWGWHATRDLAAMCHDAWHFEQLNPAGYAGRT